MNPKQTINALIAGGAQAAEEQRRAEARQAARVAWVKEVMAALRAAQDRVTEAWDRILDALPDDLSEEELEKLPEPPEQAELDAILAQIEAVRDHDRWPKELYWSL